MAHIPIIFILVTYFMTIFSPYGYPIAPSTQNRFQTKTTDCLSLQRVHYSLVSTTSAATSFEVDKIEWTHKTLGWTTLVFPVSPTTDSAILVGQIMAKDLSTTYLYWVIMWVRKKNNFNDSLCFIFLFWVNYFFNLRVFGQFHLNFVVSKGFIFNFL